MLVVGVEIDDDAEVARCKDAKVRVVVEKVWLWDVGRGERSLRCCVACNWEWST